MKLPRTRILLLGLGAVVVVGVLILAFGSRESEARYVTTTVERGDIAEVVGATGTLQAVTTVQVGSQVSGTIQQLQADFNSRVQKGQVVARLDPSLFEARLGQARANLVSARANVERSQAALVDARQKLARAEELAKENLLPQSDLETARANYSSAAAQVKGSQAAVTQAAAAVNQAEVDLGHTVIRAPIDGIVVARNVDVGQTVAASLQAPTLFVIAQDLSRMQVLASIDEADIGRVHAGQTATFRVDSFPEQTFQGRVEQVRLQPTTAQNVVTYNAIVSVENPGQRLMPGMTATVSLVVRQREDVLRIPAAALRFRPEQEGDRGERRQPGTAGAGEGRQPGAVAGGGIRGTTGEGRRRFREGPAGDAPRPRGDGGAAPSDGGAGASTGASAGAPEGERGRPAVVWIPGQDGRPRAQRVRLGITDGQFVEVVAGLEEGTPVITGLEGETRAGRPASPPGSNPFNPQQPTRRQR